VGSVIRKEREMKKFKVGDTFTSVDIFTGGRMYYEVTDRTETEIICNCSDTELDGMHSRTESFTVELDNGNEYVTLWTYSGHKGYYYAENETDFKVGDIVYVKKYPDTDYKNETGIERHHSAFFGKVTEIDNERDCIFVNFDNRTEWCYSPEELGLATELKSLTLEEFERKFNVSIRATYNV